MRTFDILDPKAPLLGAKILEASAGTGKTFAIEQLIVRLLLETPIEIEEILAITYTRAAARELWMRIRENLKKALLALSSNRGEWPYLSRHFGSKESIRKIESALLSFESAQIFTIHGFCQRMLSEFALEARSMQMNEETAPLGKALRADLLDFLEKQQSLGPEQMQMLLKKKEFARFLKDLLNSPLPAKGEGSFLEDCQALAEAIRGSSHRPLEVEEAFAKIEGICKYTGFNRAEIAEQLQALKELFCEPTSKEAVRRLLAWKGSLFDFVSIGNRKKGKESFPQQPLFDWCIRHLLPLIERASDPRRLFRRLRIAWQEPFEKLLEERGLFSPDFLLENMVRSLSYPGFAAQIQRRYKAAIIDEFQDTDAMQWEIFSTLFKDLSLFYLVGDPKQSIYRFRNADLYTYYRARSFLGPDAEYSLDTNYRSSPELVEAINNLFGENHVHPWLWLPGEQRTEPYQPVRAGLRDAWDPGDGCKPLQFFQVANLKEETYAYIAEHIQRLRPHLAGFRSFAILVQSNQQAALIQDYLQRFSLPCAAKSRSSLGSSLAMQVLEELFDALFFPRDPSTVKLFLAGPLVGKPLEEISDLPQLLSWKNTLDCKGMAPFFREFLAFRWDGGPNFYEKIAGCGTAFFRDFFQLLETLLSKGPESYEAIQRMFREIEEADPEEDASARRRMDAGEDAIQILTMHTSKGLEFDVVFAIGAATPTPALGEDLEEAEAEKLRQLYVALTRAKRRLYIPLAPTKTAAGGEPPLELLWKRSKLGSVEKLIELNRHMGLDPLRTQSVPLIRSSENSLDLIAPEPLSLPRPLGSLYSYSSLLVQKERAEPLSPLGAGQSIHTLPRGAEVGVLFHRIFERIFIEKKSVEAIVQDEIRFSELSEWEEVVLETIHQALSLPLLQNLDPSQVRPEVEFFFHAPPHFFKGCIDLVFLQNGRIYFLDWKTNWLGENGKSYSEKHLQAAMDEHNYWMQASLYAEAIRRAWPKTPLGGAIYFFVRGGVLSFEPEPFRLPHER